MRNIILLLSLTSLLFSCGKEGDRKTADQTYAMLEQVAELNAGGNKQAALSLADSALQMRPADSTRCWLMSEKTVALTDMGRMPEAIATASEGLQLAEKLGDVESMLNLYGATGIAYRRQGKVDSALVQYKKDIELALKEHNSEYEIYLNNCVTVLYSENNRFPEAIRYAEKAEKAALAAGDTIEHLSARANIGGIYLRQDQAQKALDATLPYWPEVEHADYNVLTLKFLSIILKSYSLLGNDQAVEAYMRYADHAMAGVSMKSNGALGIMETKAHLLGAQGKFREQLALLDTMMANSSENQVMPMESMLWQKALCLEKMGRKAEALVQMKEAYQLLDSVKRSDIEKSMSEFSVKYKTLETEMALADSKRKAAELTNQLLWLVILIVILIAVVCIMLYRKRWAAQKAIQQELQSYISGQEDERERIAKELHDGVCNDILAAKLMLATDRQNAEEYLNEVWQNVRHLSHELMPPDFKQTTLDVATRSYVAAIRDSGKHTVNLDISHSFDWHCLPQQVAYEMYRIIQEGTANALKYGDGNRIEISLQADKDRVSLHIVNGVRQDKGHQQETAASGIGKQTLQKRACRIGAQLTITIEDLHHVLSLTYELKTKSK